MQDQVEELDLVDIIIKLPHQKGKELKLKFSKINKVQTIIEYLSFENSTKYYTNYALVHNHVHLSPEQTLNEITKGSTLDLLIKLKPYNSGELLKHVLTCRDLFGFTRETNDGISDFSISTGSSFSDMPFFSIKDSKMIKDQEISNERGDHVIQITDKEKVAFLELANNFLENEKIDMQSTLHSNSSVISPCIRSLNFSGYNPVPAFFKTQNHIGYLQVITLEGEVFHITATSSGFFVSRSTANKFDPLPKQDSVIKFTLFDLLIHHSKKFQSHVNQLEARLTSREPVDYIKPYSTFLHKPWFLSLPSNSSDYFQLQLDSLDLQTERNYNDEFQAVKDMKSTTFSQFVEGERLLSKIIHEFNVEAVKGSMSILYDGLIALNPDSPKTEQIYLKNSIFYSFIGDINGSFAEKGGDEAAHAASNQDLTTIKLLNRFNLKNIRHLLTAIIEFGGRRILAQTPVPGLLNSMGVKVIEDPENGEQITQELTNDISIVYGFDETTGQLVYSEDFDFQLAEFSKAFHLKSHQIGDINLNFSSYSKGLVGIDKRNYILDLANTHPLDIEFVRENFDDVDKTARYPHRQTLIRHELIEKWWVSKVESSKLDLIQAFKDNEFAFNPDAYQIEGIEDETVVEISKYLRDEVLPNVVREFAEGEATAPYNGEHLTNIMHKNGINLRYLGKLSELAKIKLSEQISKRQERLHDVEKTNREHEAWETQYLKKIETLIKERQDKINALVKKGMEVPKELTQDLTLDEKDIRKPTINDPAVVNKDQLNCLIQVAESEIITRSLKHILRNYSKDLPISVVPSLIAHVFNLLLGTTYNLNPQIELMDQFYANDSFEFSKMNRDNLLNQVIQQAKLRFRYELPSDWITEFEAKPFLLIRSLSNKFGIQWLNKNYFFSKAQFEDWRLSQDKKLRAKIVAPLNTFSVHDFSLRPIVKTADFQSIIAEDYWTQGATIINNKEQETEGLNLLSQSLAVKENVNGILHPSVAESYLAMSSVYSNLKLYDRAILFCRKACVIYERVLGLDSFETINCFTNLAILEMNNQSLYNAVLALQRVKFLLGPMVKHPGIINAYTLLSSMAHSIGDIGLSIKILNKLSEHILKIEGEKSLAYGYNQSRVGNLYASKKNLNQSLKCIMEAHSIFAKELGLNDKTTVQSKQWISGIEAMIQTEHTELNNVSKVPVSSNAGKNRKKHQHTSNHKLSSKSIDELMKFIEGSDKQHKR